MTNRFKFQRSTTFALFYGIGQSDQLQNFDIAIVESSGQGSGDIALLKSSSTKPIAYVSVMEIADYDPNFQLLLEEDFLKDQHGNRVRNHAFGTYLIDLTSKRWQGLLFHRIGSLLWKHGYEGVFLDTIGNVELHQLPGIHQTEQFLAAVDLVKQLRCIFPNALIIQNNGLNRLFEQTYEWIDGLCWENPNFIDKKSLEWTQNTLERVTSLAARSGIKVFLLIETDPSKEDENMNKAREIARRYQFLIYGAPFQYVAEVYN